MNYKIIISTLLTCLAIAAPLCLISLQSEPYTLAWDKLLYHIFLLLGVAILYWSVGLMHYMELKKCNAQSAVEQFSVLVYPMTFLVVLSIELLGLFSLSERLMEREADWI